MQQNRLPLLVLMMVPALFAACGSRNADNASDPDASFSADAGAPEADIDSGPLFPASHPVIPHVVSGGTVMAAPKVVSVSFQNDPLEGDIDTFVTAIGQTTYWGDRTKEYGIGPLTPTARVHDTMETWAASIDDSQIETWLTSQLDGTHPEYPAPDNNTVYALYFPPNVSITFAAAGLPASCGTDSAPSWHGYHSDLALPTGQNATYAVISRCDSIPEDPAAVGIQYVSAVASHELIEAITDPFVETGPDGYSETDPDHIAFSYASLAELGDMCALVSDAFYTPSDFPYLVQRIWSNATAPTGHDPCLPEPAGQVYFNSAPVLTDTISLQGAKTKGVSIPAGQSKTIEIDLFSEAPTSGPWTVQAYEMDSAAALSFSFDKKTGENGDVLNLTIKVAEKASGGEIFAIVSTLGKQQSVWVGGVGN